MSILSDLFKDPNQKVIAKLQLKVEQCNQLEAEIEKLSDAKIVFFSVYVWNFNLSSEIAKKIKE